jgi:pyruvate formate lyase activating enzyme
VQEVLEEIERDAPFFRRTAGGVTLSGGEPLQQIEFTTALLRAARELGIHTALETSGYAAWTAFMRVIPHVNQFLFDVKLIDGRFHKRFTGVDNASILRNLDRLSRIHDDVIVRYPLIPSYNDHESQITALTQTVKALGPVKRVEILPHHRYSEHKYDMLGREYPLTGVVPPAVERTEWICRRVRSAGLECRVLP